MGAAGDGDGEREKRTRVRRREVGERRTEMEERRRSSKLVAAAQAVEAAVRLKERTRAVTTGSAAVTDCLLSALQPRRGARASQSCRHRSLLLCCRCAAPCCSLPTAASPGGHCLFMSTSVSAAMWESGSRSSHSLMPTKLQRYLRGTFPPEWGGGAHLVPSGAALGGSRPGTPQRHALRPAAHARNLVFPSYPPDPLCPQPSQGCRTP